MFHGDIKVIVVRYPDRKFLRMRYVDPGSGRQRVRSTGTTSHRAAERIAAKWEAELQEGRYHKPSAISWEEFRERYQGEKLSALARGTEESANSAFNHLERLVRPKKLAAVDASLLSQFQAELRKTGIEETSVATHLRHIRAALSWAASMGLLATVPKIQMPKRTRGKVLMRGRPITAAEFQRMLAIVDHVRPHDSAQWRRYLEGLWLSGLRLEESTALSWDEDSTILADFSGRHPRLRIFAEAEKGHQDRLLPMTPDFAEFLLGTPEPERVGRVFPILGLRSGRPMSVKRISRIISCFGTKAGIVVNRSSEKFASAHDLRRAFGTRWSRRVKPATLQLLMRHKSIETTLRYYVDQDADEIADELWTAYAEAKRVAANSRGV